MMSRTEVVRFLIANGADTELRDGHGRTPLELAKDRTLHQFFTKATDEYRTANTNYERTTKMSFWSKLFGKKTAEPAAEPAQLGFTSQLLSVADIQRNDQEMGEMYLHCPKCGEDERINDMGKMMLKQGNNVFANYKCKKCGVAFDGAKHNVSRNT